MCSKSQLKMSRDLIECFLCRDTDSKTSNKSVGLGIREIHLSCTNQHPFTRNVLEEIVLPMETEDSEMFKVKADIESAPVKPDFLSLEAGSFKFSVDFLLLVLPEGTYSCSILMQNLAVGCPSWTCP